MSLVLDTDVLIDLESGQKQTKLKLAALAKEYPASPQVTFVSLFEFLLGIKVRREKKRQQALSFLKNFGVLHTTDESSRLLADLKFEYGRKGIVLSLADLVVATLVIENNLILVTRDKDFEKITELKKIFI